MKVKLTMEIDVPDELLEGDSDEPSGFNPDWGYSWEFAFAKEEVFRNVVTYSMQNHAVDYMDYQFAPNATSTDKAIALHHKNWKEIIEKACETMKLEEIV